MPVLGACSHSRSEPAPDTTGTSSAAPVAASDALPAEPRKPSLAALHGRLGAAKRLVDEALARGAETFAAAAVTRARDAITDAEWFLTHHPDERAAAESRVEAALFDARRLTETVARHDPKARPGAASVRSSLASAWPWLLGAVAIFAAGFLLGRRRRGGSETVPFAGPAQREVRV